MNKKEKYFRLFFAIPIEDSFRIACQNFIDLLKNQIGEEKVKWVKYENFHITLCFMEKVPEEKVEMLIKAADAALKDSSAFSLEVGKSVLLPLKHVGPHALVLSFPLLTSLMTLHTKIQDAVIACGLPIEKRDFFPHLTLGRISKELAIDLNSLVFSEFPKQITVNEIVLYESLRTNEGSQYNSIASFFLI